MVITDPPLFRALQDMIECLTIPHVAAVNCGRIVDGIRRQIAPALVAKQGWAAMQKALNISRSYQEYISGISTGPRHADPSFIPGSTNIDIVRRTWIILDRYLEYKKRGETILTPPDFPELV
jgi:hypothetical protein